MLAVQVHSDASHTVHHTQSGSNEDDEACLRKNEGGAGSSEVPQMGNIRCSTCPRSSQHPYELKYVAQLLFNHLLASLCSFFIISPIHTPSLLYPSENLTDCLCCFSRHRKLHDRPYKYTHEGCNSLGFSSRKDLTPHETSRQHHVALAVTFYCPRLGCEYHTVGFSRKDNRDRHIQIQHNTLFR